MKTQLKFFSDFGRHKLSLQTPQGIKAYPRSFPSRDKAKAFAKTKKGQSWIAAI